jgi:hypothetical protein
MCLHASDQSRVACTPRLVVARLQCRDPAALTNSTRVPINCTGFAVSNPSSMLQRMLLPVINTDVIDVEVALQSVAPAKEAPAAGKNACRLSFSRSAVASPQGR